MKKFLDLPHSKYESTCYINGLYDILAWKGGLYEYFLLPVIGGMAGFSYLKFKQAVPPQMVYWGNSPKYLLKELSPIVGFSEEISEGRSWKTLLERIRESIGNNMPVVAGALDMFHLNYYTHLYKRTHVPIHYVLITGYDDDSEEFSILDCSYENLQKITYDDLRMALDVNVPGMSKKNTIRIFRVPDRLPDELEVTEKGFRHKAERMLNPPVSLTGIPAMRKLAKEITGWNNKESFRHMVAYAGMTPPLIPRDLSQSNGLRFRQAGLLETLGRKYGRANWTETAGLFRKSGELIISLCREAVKYDGKKCSGILTGIATIEEEAYKMLTQPD